ncbi:MAG: DUF2101 family protein [Candidatus Hydrothermarchaeota archaeon]
MKLFRKIGDYTVRLIEHIGEAVLRAGEGAIRLPETTKKGILSGRKEIESLIKKEREIPEPPKFLISFLARFHADKKDFLVLKLQIASILFVLSVVASLFRFLSLKILFIIAIFIFSFVFYVLIFQIRFAFPEDRNAYYVFFGFYLLMPLFLLYVDRITPSNLRTFGPNSPSPYLILFALITVGIFFLFFNRKYGREYTIGKVLDTKESLAEVRIGYDLCSGVSPNIYFLENGPNAKKGDLVKVSVLKKPFSFRSAKPQKILEVLG